MVLTSGAVLYGNVVCYIDDLKEKTDSGPCWTPSPKVRFVRTAVTRADRSERQFTAHCVGHPIVQTPCISCRFGARPGSHQHARA